MSLLDLELSLNPDYFFPDTPNIEADDMEWAMYLLKLPEWKLLHIQGLKKCIQSECHEVKSLDEFDKNSARRDGYQDWCKTCMSQWKQAKVKHQLDTSQALKSGKDFSSFEEYHNDK